jgi:hypothetical protein
MLLVDSGIDIRDIYIQGWSLTICTSSHCNSGALDMIVAGRPDVAFAIMYVRRSTLDVYNVTIYG